VKANARTFGGPTVRVESELPAELLSGGVWDGESEGEYFFFVEHALSEEAAEVRFEVSWPDCPVRAVVCEGRYVPFSEFDGSLLRFAVDVGGLRPGNSKTLDVHTHFAEPGLTIRVEQNDPVRCAGWYAGRAWPQTQIDAVAHYLFASREIVRALSLPSFLDARGLGYIALMGFETNNPVHGDYPPHWHLIFRWPNFAGSQAPHFYLDERGRNTHNCVTIDGVPGASAEYGPEAWCLLKDRYAADAFAVAVCEDGGIAVTAPEKAVYRMSAYSPGEGVRIFRDDAPIGRMRVANDTREGRMEIRWERDGAAPEVTGSYTEAVAYDALLGARIDRP
jgi:hypothetical protein